MLLKRKEKREDTNANAQEKPESAQEHSEKTQNLSNPCPKCSKDVQADAKFCPYCGCNVSKASKQQEKESELATSTNDLIGFRYMHENGIAETHDGRFSRIIEFSDVNYEDEREDQQSMIYEQQHHLHSYFRVGTIYQINLANIPVKNESAKRFLPEMGADASLAQTYNLMLELRMREGHTDLLRRNTLAFSVSARDLEDAEASLASIREGTTKIFNGMSSNTHTLDGMEWMHLMHDLIRTTDAPFDFDYSKVAFSSRTHARDWIAPAWAKYSKGDSFYSKILFPNYVAKSYLIRDFDSELSDKALRQVRALPIPMNISLLFVPQNNKEMENRVRTNIAGIQGNIFQYQQNMTRQGADFTMLPPKMEEDLDNAQEELKFLTDRDQKVAWTQGLITIFAPDEKTLAWYEESLLDTANNVSFRLESWGLNLRQEEAFISAQPLAAEPRLENTYRSLLTSERANLIPFSAQVVQHDPKTSYMLGWDSVSNQPIFADPSRCKSPHMWLFGMTGAGKGMLMNSLLYWILLQNPRTVQSQKFGGAIGENANAPDIQVFDFHAEYCSQLTRLGAQVNKIGPTSQTCLNPLDFANNEGKLTAKAVSQNSDFFLALMQSVMGRALDQKEKSILDRCANEVFEPCIGTDKRPTLTDLYEQLQLQDDALAADLAAALEIYVTGSLSAFNGETCVNHGANCTVYDFSTLGESMKTFALLSTLQHVRLRVFENNRKGRSTICIVEEVQSLFDDDAAVRFLDSMFSELRKFGLRMICVTQLPRRVLEHHRARYLFDNSSIFVMLANLSENAERMGDIFNLSESQMQAMSPTIEPGSGLVIVDGLKMGMRNYIPERLTHEGIDIPNELYELWNTDPKEKEARRAAQRETEIEDARK